MSCKGDALKIRPANIASSTIAVRRKKAPRDFPAPRRGVANDTIEQISAAKRFWVSKIINSVENNPPIKPPALSTA
jgi:hypothetical protein